MYCPSGILHLALEKTVGKGVFLVVLQLVPFREEALGLLEGPSGHQLVGRHPDCAQLDLKLVSNSEEQCVHVYGPQHDL